MRKGASSKNQLRKKRKEKKRENIPNPVGVQRRPRTAAEAPALKLPAIGGPRVGGASALTPSLNFADLAKYAGRVLRTHAVCPPDCFCYGFVLGPWLGEYLSGAVAVRRLWYIWHEKRNEYI